MRSHDGVAVSGGGEGQAASAIRGNERIGVRTKVMVTTVYDGGNAPVVNTPACTREVARRGWYFCCYGGGVFDALHGRYDYAERGALCATPLMRRQARRAVERQRQGASVMPVKVGIHGYSQGCSRYIPPPWIARDNDDESENRRLPVDANARVAHASPPSMH